MIMKNLDRIINPPIVADIDRPVHFSLATGSFGPEFAKQFRAIRQSEDGALSAAGLDPKKSLAEQVFFQTDGPGTA